jgi:hypothetical protein
MMNSDLISRSALIKMLRFKRRAVYGSGSMDDIARVIEDVEKFPDAKVGKAEPVRHGWWEPVFRSNVFGEHYVERHACSICKELALSRCENYMDDEELSNYCPNCGAKMDAEVE